MKFYEHLKSILLSTIYEFVSDPTLYARNPGKDFTRNRKFSFKQFIQMLLTLESESLKEELYLFFGRNEDVPSKAVFYKQRQKLHKDALANLLFAFNKKLEQRLYKGKYQLITFVTEDFKELYFMRWNEETAFRYLKYTLCLKALHTKKYDYVIQEVWAGAILFNFSSEIMKPMTFSYR